MSEDFPAHAFAPEVIEPAAWKLKGVGMYGSDVDVVSLDSYRELAKMYGYAADACIMWARKCIALEGGNPGAVAEEPLRAMAKALRIPLAAILDALDESPASTTNREAQ